MNCRGFQRHLMMKYFDGALSQVEQNHFQRHLDSCPRCRDYFTDLEEILDSLATTTPIAPHPELPRRIMERIKQSQPVKAAPPARTLAGAIVNQIPVLLLLLMTVALGINLRNAAIYDLMEPMGQIINQCSGALIVLQSVWGAIGRLFPSQISGIMNQIQWISLVVILAAFTLFARKVVLKLKNE